MKKGLVLLFALTLAVSSVSAQKLKAEEIIAKHLASIATPDKRASIKSMVVIGELKLEFVSPKNLPAVGRMFILSEGDKSFFGMQTNSNDYPQEKILFDGSKAHIASVRGASRSILGNFIQSNSGIVSQGILTGTLATSWNLLKAAERDAKISVSGTRKVDGKEAYVLAISPKGGSDIDITMYFDQQSFRHLRTEYKRQSSAAQGRTIDESARNSETRLKVTEDFSDHQVVDGVTVPGKYRLHYMISGQQGTTEVVWTANFTEVGINKPIDPSTFLVAN